MRKTDKKKSSATTTPTTTPPIIVSEPPSENPNAVELSTTATTTTRATVPHDVIVVLSSIEIDDSRPETKARPDAAPGPPPRSSSEWFGKVPALNALRRNTIQLARDAILRRFSRGDASSRPTTSAQSSEDMKKSPMFKRPDLVHEINHLLALYHQSLQSVGTTNDNQITREELSCSRTQCLKGCDTAKNCILPQLKNETQNPHHGSEFTKQANQFIGCVNMFVNDMKRCKNLLRLFPAPITECVSIPGDSGASSSSTQSGNRDSIEKEMENLERDLKEAEGILEALENAVTVHFSTKDHAGNSEEVTPTQQSSRKKGCQCGKICSYFKTSYA